MISPQGGGLTRDGIRLLRQEEATSAAVKTAMREIFDLTQPGDTVILFAASHGLPNAMNKFDIVLHDTEFPKHKAGTKEQPLDFVITKRSTALADDDLQNWVTQLTLRDVRTVVILDTCYSGKTFVSIPGYLPARTFSLHWIEHTGLRNAVAHYLKQERRAVDADIAALAEHAPFKKAPKETSDGL